jgi:hypothetical protein
MRHKWTNPDGLQYNPNDYKSMCQKCGIIRLRMSNLKAHENVIYYYSELPEFTEYKAPKCK